MFQTNSVENNPDEIYVQYDAVTVDGRMRRKGWGGQVIEGKH